MNQQEYKKQLEQIFLDNTDIDNLGIVKWAKYTFPDYITNEVANYQKQIYYEILKLFDPLYKNRYERLLEFIVFRGGGKSTITNFIIPCYLITFNKKTFKIKIDNEIKECKIDEGLIVIVSKTYTSAQEFTQRIRDEFTTNKILRIFNNGKVEEALDDITGEWTKSAFKINGIYVLAVGTGQQIRGKVKGASRPTTIIFDDIYSEENVKTKETRQNIRNWFKNAAMNTIDDIKGKAIVVGTIVHEDTIIVDLEHNEQWKTIKMPLMELETYEWFLKNHMVYDEIRNCYYIKYYEIEDRKERILKAREYYKKVQEEMKNRLAWSDRLDLYSIALKTQEASLDNALSSIYQEYFHITISENEKTFRREYFRKIEGRFFIENNHTYFETNGQVYPINVEIGVDIAAGLQTSDDTAIAIVGKLSDNRIIILDIIAGKFGIRDIIRNYDKADRYRKIVVDRNYITKVGYVDEIIRLSLHYHPSKIKIGIGGSEIAIVNEMRRILTENSIFIPIIPYQQTSRQGSKEERIKNILLQFYETKMIYHYKPFETLEYQLEWLGKTKNDDIADAVANAVYQLSEPYHLYSQNKNNYEDYYTPLLEDYDWRLN